MKKNLLIAALIGALSVTAAYAIDPSGAMAIFRGYRPETVQASVGTGANVAIVSGDGARYDLTCRNHSAFTIYIGTNTAGTTLTGVGFPIYANEAFPMDAFSSAVYAIAVGGTADVRCWTGLR